jgi:hypothetical protein
MVLLLTLVSHAETPVSGTVVGIWNPGGSPYMVQGDLEVPADSMLIIKPGVWVIFEGDYEFVVDGIVLALGEEEDSIYFTTDPGVTWSGFKYFNNPDTSRFYYCLFENADTYPDGYGGVFFLYQSNGIVEHCTFQHNWANRGAAMYSLWGHVQFRHNVCWDNHVNHCGGAINLGNDANSVVERCVFYDNTSGASGGAIYFWDDHCQVINCTIVQNTSPAVLSINGSTSAFVNCIFWENSMGSVYSATYCDVEGGWPGMGNINANPMFVDPGNDDFHLMANSPCIDAGNPLSPFDPDGTIADMGAYYFDQISWQPGNLLLYLDPVNPPIVIPSQGGSFGYTAAITCDLTGYAIFDAWTELVLPNGQTMGPLILREDLFMAAGDSIFREIEMYVSAWAMPGLYEMHGYLGYYPDSILATDSFEFEKESTDGLAPGSGDAWAALSGWGDTERVDLPNQQTFAISANQHLKVTCTPNPFNPETVLRFNLPAAGQVELNIYDLSGRLVSTLLNRHLNAGTHAITFDGSRLASGIYLAVAEWDNQQAVSRLLLLK